MFKSYMYLLPNKRLAAFRKRCPLEHKAFHQSRIFKNIFRITSTSNQWIHRK